jgi:YD repeat-containing protein
MLPAAKQEMLSPFAPSSARSGEGVFSFAAGVPLAARESHQGVYAPRGKKPHQGIFSKNRTLRIGGIWAKWSGTHQDRKCSWSETVTGSALDANGNTLSDAQGRSFTWDFENRLVQAVNPGVGTTIFKYDPFGRRIQKSGPLGPTNYLFDGDNPLEEVDSAGNVLARYTLSWHVDDVLSAIRAGTTNYYEEDGLGSVTTLSNSSGALANTYTYDSFGNLNPSQRFDCEFLRFTASEFDSETGLYNYRTTGAAISIR